ncbi:glycerophosphoryl diester phosphodiesterase [Paenibacillus endophyticus]|uniref:Glycerophosphoryl diester phosphodiesterase n=1 Tax=Paenibacillus endophyticus TaxID=1294268 RepID=A0A7W5GCD4_9BACL|nr:glycerophosphodiester phosphodiesterase [Paenibacillus endophyticus]MBB3154705.1 glycerophosphoryl diester phosphodiesterase [Paenibacillus endophyticus]
MAFPLITAHTGCMGEPDNTAGSALAGIALGADIVEDDIRITRDGVPVLFHDEWVSLKDGNRMGISLSTYDELRHLDIIPAHAAGSQTIRLAALDELLAIVRSAGCHVNLDIKVDEAIAPTAAAVRKFGLEKRAFLSGCGANRALLARAEAPWLPRLLNADADLFDAVAYSEAVKRTIEDAVAAACFGINIQHRHVREELLASASDCGLFIYTWTVNESEQIAALAASGVRSITTRRVDLAMGLKTAR